MKRLAILLCPAALAMAAILSSCGRSSTTAHDAPSDNTQPQDTASDTDSSTPAEPDHASEFKPSTRPLLGSSDVPLLEQIDRENTRVVAAAAPSLVRVTSLMQVDPHEQLMGFPFRIPGVPHGMRTVVPSYGSGVIISRDGYVVTNYHVIRDARSVEVGLGDQRSFAAHILASDPDSDIAVLKIDATGLPALPWGDSDKIQVGQQVFALGNPFNLDTSVSKGIVSGVGRNLPDVETGGTGDIKPEYEDYIQTDAAINVGNSGGALIDIHGRLIGINAAIASFTQGSEGVGFSIPSNLVRSTVEQLIKTGHLARGYLGVRLPVRVDDGVPEQLGLDSDRGALLAGVQRSSPADQAKLRPVDCIVEVDGHRIDSLPQFRLIVAQIPVGKEVVVNYIRAGAPHTATIRIGELPKDSEAPLSDPPADAPPAPVTVSSAPTANHVLAGVDVTDLTDKTRQQYGVDDFVSAGVVVTGVQEGTTADQKGLLRGDVIEIACVQRGTLQTLGNSADFAGMTKALKADQPVVLLVHHGKLSGAEDRSSTFLYLAPEAR
jgi:serine protease Do